MLSNETRKRLERILSRLAANKPVTLQERIYLNKYADKDQTISSLISKAKRQKQNNVTEDGIDRLVNELDLGSPDPDTCFRSNENDLGEWFCGAPSWVTRS